MTVPRTPHSIQVWTWPMAVRPDLDPPQVPTVPVRIGDAERDRAMAALGDHFAAGRLNKEEFDARVDQAMAARFDRDLQPLFADLPRAEPMAGRPVGPPRLRAGWPLLLWWLPLLLVGAVIVTVLLSAPWLIWTFCWVLFISAFWGGRRRHHYRHYR
jgi:hypothetical protein